MSLLCADYGSSSEGEDSDNEEEPSNAKKPSVQTGPSGSSSNSTYTTNSTTTRATKDGTPLSSSSAPKNSVVKPDVGSISDSDDSFSGHISDEDEYDGTKTNASHISDEDDADVNLRKTAKVDVDSAPSAVVDADVIGFSGKIGLWVPSEGVDRDTGGLKMILRP